MKIPFKGIVKNTPAGLAQDGELEDIINLRYKDGAWRPIPERVAIFDNLAYTNIFIHSNSGYKHYLGLKTNGEFEYFANDINNEPKQFTPEPITTLTSPTFTQIGNVININDSGLKHLIWYDNKYVLIDSNFDGTQTSSELIGKVDLKVDRTKVTANNIDYIKLSFIKTEEVNYDKLSDCDDAIDDRSKNAVSLGIKLLNLIHSNGELTGFLMACTAIELYDGSYILHSNPILLGQAGDVDDRYSFNISSELHEYNNNPAVFNSILSGTLNSSGYYEGAALTKAYDSSTSGIPANITANNPNILLQYSASYSDDGMFSGNDVSGLLEAASTTNQLKFKINSDIPLYLKPLIKSISVFITDQVNIRDYNYEIISKSVKVKTWLGSRDERYDFVENYSPKIKTNAEIITELSELKNFYKVHEIPFDDIKTTDWTVIDLKNKLGDSLLTQEPLPWDNFSHHQTLPEVQFIYNSKLHVANYQTALSRGFPFDYFTTDTGVGQFAASSQTDPTALTHEMWMVVDIKTGNGISTVIRKTIQQTPFSRKVGATMLSYPDSRAIKMTIYDIYTFVDSGTTYRNALKSEFKLKESSAGNFAYWINTNIKPETFAYELIGTVVEPAEVQRFQVFQNTLKVSEVNNPFIFPLENTYQIGNGDIVGLATNTMALSTGQFGQYPVYVFCTDGVYGLYVGGAEVNYSNVAPISREVCNNRNSIKAIDSGVVFTTTKGVMIIAGSQVQELSEVLRGQVFDINKTSLFKKALDHVKLTQLLPQITTTEIHDFLQSAIVGYNYTEREVWFTNSQYSYIFSNGGWYKVKATGTRFIDDYPKQYLLNGTKLFDISTETGTYQEVAFLTRPIKMGDVSFKQLLTTIIRGRMIVENVPGTPIQKKWAGVHVYGSYDGERWVFLGGNEKFGELNDFGTRVERTDCKYYRVAFYGNLNNDSFINYLEVEGKQSILTNKLR